MNRIIVLACITLLLAACGGGSGGKGKWDKDKKAEKKDPLVEVVPARVDYFSIPERSTGRVEARTVADVYSRASDIALDVPFEVGDYVEKDEMLARLDDSVPTLDLQSSQIAWQEAELKHQKDKLDLKKKKTDLRRIEKYINSENANERSLFSKDAFDLAKLEFDKAQNQVDSSQLVLLKAHGDLAAKAKLKENTIILAPISGYITEKNIRENELVTLNTLVFKMADTRELEVKLDVAEAALPRLMNAPRINAMSMLGLREKADFTKAQPVILTVTAFAGESFLGYVDRISPVVDQTRGMVVVTVRIIQPDEIEETDHAELLAKIGGARNNIMVTKERGAKLTLRPGMWVDARIVTNANKNVLQIPGGSLDGDNEAVWIIDRDKKDTGVGTARKVSLRNRRASSAGGQIALRDLPDLPDKEQIKEGDLIVVRGQTLLRDKARVRFRDLSK
ncbi:MAG: efflux RND transporter periplasmic adaptor subunit [Planctomycetota bacterium]